VPRVSQQKEVGGTFEGDSVTFRFGSIGCPRGKQVPALEINFTVFSKSHIETQKYWTLALQAAISAQELKLARGTRAKHICSRIHTKISNGGNSDWWQ
jgi:hypothetical protein